MSGKQRLSASVDTGLLEAAHQAVEQGRVSTLSAWVNDALRLKLEHERRREALAAFIAEHEAEFGEIGPEEMEAAARRARSRALGVRTLRPREMRRGTPGDTE